ncbi:MAG: SURF1 family protein [Gammaproteobacteria bacterium]
MAARRLTFRPPLWATLLTLGACALFAWAGFWQLDRQGQKMALFAAFDKGSEAKSIVGPIADEAATQLRYQTVVLSGRYDVSRQILLDNISRDGRAGYEVLTPLLTEDIAVLVNRGWIPAAARRDELPQVSINDEPRRIRGRLDKLPRPGLRLAGELPAADAPWPRRLLYPVAGDIEAQLGYPVTDYQVLLNPDATDGYRRDWQPKVSGPDTHLGYAVQWFAFAFTAVVIYVLLNLKRQRLPSS